MGQSALAGMEETTEEKIRRVAKIFERMFRERKVQGLQVAGEPPFHVFDTVAGTYGPTEPNEFLSHILPALGTSRTIVDLGSGIGHWAQMAAVARPDAQVWGIEYDEILHQESETALAFSVQEGLIRPEQVKFLRGDFYDPKFEGLLRNADLVYYFAGGTRDDDRLAEMLRRLIIQPNAQVMVNSEDENPLPPLTQNGLFSPHNIPPFTVVYTRTSTGDTTPPPIASGLEENRRVILRPEQITAAQIRSRYGLGQTVLPSETAFIIAAAQVASQILFYYMHDTVEPGLARLMANQRDVLPKGVELALVAAPASPNELRRPGGMFIDRWLPRKYEQFVLPEIPVTLGEPLPSLPSLILWILRGSGGEIIEVKGVLKLEENVFAYFV